jgi:cysteine desulfurase
LRDLIIQAVLAGIPGSYLTGHPVNRLPNHASFVFDNLDGNHLVAILDAAGYCCSSGSACKSGNPQPSEILLGIGLPRELALGSLRVTVGKDTTKKDVMEFLEVLPEMVSRARRNFRV